MDAFVAWSGDTTTQITDHKALTDDVEGLRRLARALEAGQMVWKSWVELGGGSVVSMGNGEGRIQVPISKLEELSRVVEQYSGAIASKTSVGIGMKLSEAERALQAAKLRGGDKIVFYDPSIDQEIQQAKEKEGGTDPLVSLAKDEGATRPVPPKTEASEHSETESFLSMLNDPDRPKPPEATHAAKDLEEHFHSLAQQQGVQDDQDRQVSEQNIDRVKAQVVQALQAVRAQGQKLDLIRQSSPEVYTAIMGVVQAMIVLGREVSGDEQPVKKTESESPDFEPLEKALPRAAPELQQPLYLVHFSPKPDLRRIDIRHMGQGAPASEYRQGLPETGRAYYYLEGSKPEPLVLSGARAKYVGVLPPHHRIYDLAGNEDGLVTKANKLFLAGKGKESAADTVAHVVKRAGYCGYRNTASSLPHVIALFHDLPVISVPIDGTTKVPEAIRNKLPSPAAHPVRKAGLPMPTPKGPATPRVELPIGTALAGKVKVQHADGSLSWKGVRAGQIRSQDPTGHPTSSREPNAR